jgi:hypothetical protein
MEVIGNTEAAERKVLADASTLISSLITCCGEALPKSAREAVGVLANIRDLAYENLNQIQHEYLILIAAAHLTNTGAAPPGTEWSWNPRQTGGSDEPDLRGTLKGAITLSCEVTTSRRPVGTIEARMRATLKKLSAFPGRQFYFVRTKAMENKACMIVSNVGYAIEVVRLPHSDDEL